MEAANNTVGLELDDESGDPNGVGETQAIWGLQQEIVSLSYDKISSYKTSRFLFSTNENNKPSSTLGGGIVADGSLGPQAVYKPTLIIALPLVIQTQINDWQDYFANSFIIRVLHIGQCQVSWVKKVIMSIQDVKEIWDEDYLGYLTIFFQLEWAKAYNKQDSLQPYIDFLVLPPESQTITGGLHLLDPELFLDNLEGSASQCVEDAIPPFKARTVELDLSGLAQAEYKDSHEAVMPNLHQRNPNAQDQDREEPTIVFNNYYLQWLSHIFFSILLEWFVDKVSHNGVQEINKFRQYHDLGAQYFTRHTMLGWGMPVPHSCADLVVLLANHWPKMAYLSGLLAEMVLEKGEKVVLFAE
ncbi:MAG: hypothetical protein M1839_002142 [Geoglossum umbratile]|nr:MAG: hypothetical protein M1839_002142 [Geoglossum umbratile]